MEYGSRRTSPNAFANCLYDRLGQVYAYMRFALPVTLNKIKYFLGIEMEMLEILVKVYTNAAVIYSHMKNHFIMENMILSGD